MRFVAVILALLAPSVAFAQTYPNPLIVATGSTTARTMGDRAATKLNIKDFGAVMDGTTDDSAAWIAAINAANAQALTGTRACIYEPAGVSLIVSTLPMFVRNGCIEGEGVHRSYVKLDPSYVGDVFSWSEAWYAADYFGTTINTTNTKLGPIARNITITGSQAATSQQNAFVFYDRVDEAMFDHVHVIGVKGRGFYAGGLLKTSTQAYMRESRFFDFKFISSGTATIPVVELTSTGTGDATDTVKFFDLDILSSNGPGLWIHNGNNATDTTRYIQIFGLRVEGGQPVAGLTGDGIKIGDAADAGTTKYIDIYGMMAGVPYSGYCAVRLAGASLAAAPRYINMFGTVFSGPVGSGKGVCIDSGAEIHIGASISSLDTNVTVASSATVGAPIIFDGSGGETAFTSSIDATSQQFVKIPVYLQGGFNTAPNTQSIPGSLFGGTNSAAANANNGVFVGSTNRVFGNNSAISGGIQAYDKARINSHAFSGGQFTLQGDAQDADFVMRCSTTTATACRLTGDGAAAGSGNCANLPNANSHNIRVGLHARDATTAGTDYDWSLPTGFMTRDANAASTTITLGTPVILSRGTVTGAGVTATADTTNGCLNLSFTPPTGNTDTWHVVARVETVEVQ